VYSGKSFKVIKKKKHFASYTQRWDQFDENVQ
jgi:hypothetical protein